MKPLPLQRAPRTGFTLMELMVVTAIIVLLAALALPAISKMTRAAQSNYIAAQMRQLSQAVFAYAGDHDGQLPGPLWDGQGFRYKSSRPEVLFTHIGSYFGVQNIDSNWRIADSLMTPPQRDFWRKINNDAAAFFKITVTGSVIPFGYSAGTTLIQPMRLQAIPDLASTYMFREADQKASWVYTTSGYYTVCPPAPIHGNYRFVSYFDGSIRPMSLEESNR